METTARLSAPMPKTKIILKESRKTYGHIEKRGKYWNNTVHQRREMQRFLIENFQLQRPQLELAPL
jgi:hypothetical protein